MVDCEMDDFILTLSGCEAGEVCNNIEQTVNFVPPSCVDDANLTLN